MVHDTLMAPDGALPATRPATVLEVSGFSLVVAIEGEAHRALRAAGCLLDPQEGDTVLVYCGEGGPPVVVTVLFSGEGRDKRTMTFSGGIEIASDGEIGVSARRFTGRFSECSLTGGTLSLAGEILSFTGRRIVQAGETLERVAGWLIDRARGASRHIEGVDRAHSGEFLLESERMVSVQSRTTLISGSELVKIDGDQVHLG